MVSKRIVIHCPDGIKPYKANEIVQKSLKYQSAVNIMYKNNVIDAKSVLTILGASIKKDAEIIIECHGVDEQEALEDVSIAVAV